MHEFPIDNYGSNREALREVVLLYTKVGTGTGPYGISNAYCKVDLFNKVVKLYFGIRVQPLPLGWGVYTPSLYDRVPLVSR